MPEEQTGEELQPGEQVMEGGEIGTIEGGYVGPFEELGFDDRQQRAETSRKMAFLLVWIMAGERGIHFATPAIFAAVQNEQPAWKRPISALHQMGSELWAKKMSLIDKR